MAQQDGVMNRYSGLLYAQPSFLEGVGRLVDFAGLMDIYNDSASEAEADNLALASDGYAIGDDLRQVIEESAFQQNIEMRHA